MIEFECHIFNSQMTPYSWGMQLLKMHGLFNVCFEIWSFFRDSRLILRSVVYLGLMWRIIDWLRFQVFWDVLSIHSLSHILGLRWVLITDVQRSGISLSRKLKID
ncbi:hypothetical protein ACS0TY_014135 [Phlomoides rotata]